MSSLLSWRNFVHANFRRSLAALRNGEVKLIQLRRKKRCPGPGRRLNFLQNAILIGITLLDDIDDAFSAGNVESLAPRIVKQVIAVP